jgi:hypothetical protein
MGSGGGYIGTRQATSRRRARWARALMFVRYVALARRWQPLAERPLIKRLRCRGGLCERERLVSAGRIRHDERSASSHTVAISINCRGGPHWSCRAQWPCCSRSCLPSAVLLESLILARRRLAVPTQPDNGELRIGDAARTRSSFAQPGQRFAYCKG